MQARCRPQPANLVGGKDPGMHSGAVADAPWPAALSPGRAELTAGLGVKEQAQSCVDGSGSHHRQVNVTGR
jgi:hypothetical protein